MFDVSELNVLIELWAVAFCLVGIVCSLLFAQANGHYRKVFVAAFATAIVSAGGDALAGVYRGQPGNLAWAATHVGNFATFAGGFLLLAIFTGYLYLRLGEVGRKPGSSWVRGVHVAALAMCACTMLGVFYNIDANNLYHRGGLYWLSTVFVVFVDAVNLVIIVRNRRMLGTLTFACLLFYAMAPLVASLVQMFVYGLNFIILAVSIGLVILFLEMQGHTAQTMLANSERLAKSQQELAESRIAVMSSQIQPHFLFNTLDSIYYLCDEDPARAKEAIDGFSRYLRTNLDSLKRATPVPITTELAHVRTYLELEKLSMEDLLEYEIDAQAEGFSVPALSVQTIVENAVKHGVGKRPGGGKVVVRTGASEDGFWVSVADDGVGFDVDAPLEGNHIGIENTRMRLQALCGATLENTSEPDAGTTVVMRFPKA